MKHKLIHPLRIDWSDLDYFGHVNNVSYFRFIQSARVNYWDKCGITERHLNAGIGPILASCKCDFKLPLFYPGNITIETELDFLRSSSFGFQHTLYNDNGDVAALASDVMVMFDFKKNIKVIIDEEWRHRISMKY